MMYSYILAAIIVVIYPLFIFITDSKLERYIEANEKNRLRSYVSGALINVVLIALILYGYFKHYPPHLSFYPHFNTLGIVLTILIAIFWLMLYNGSKTRKEDLNTAFEDDSLHQNMAPKTITEFNWYAIDLVSTAVADDIMYRLFLFEFLRQYVGFIAALILCNVAYVFKSSDWNKQDMLMGFSTGLLFSAIYVNTDNIWIALFFHLCITMFGGMLFNKEVLMKERS